eukprot:5602382-Amphidinium_carterae.1
MVAVIQAIIQTPLNDKMWGEDDPFYTRDYWKDPRLGRDILVFLPGTAEISLMATTLERLVRLENWRSIGNTPLPSLSCSLAPSRAVLL